MISHALRRSGSAALFVCASMLSVAGVSRGQDLIQNGSFEELTSGVINNWVVTPPAASGESSNYSGVSPYGPRFLVLNPGTSAPAGSATQDFGQTASNQLYQVSFAMGQLNTGTPPLVPEVQQLLVTINLTSVPDQLQTFTDPTPTSDLGTVWNRYTFTFTGDGAGTGITFTDTGTLTFVASDLLIDDVSIIAIPEPASLSAFAIALGGLVRRRRLTSGRTRSSHS